MSTNGVNLTEISDNDSVLATTCGFGSEAPVVMGRLAKAMRALVKAVPGEVSTAADLERNLGVTKKVAWQVHKIAEARNALAAAGFVPGADPVRKLLAAAQKRRVPAQVRSELADAFEQFEQFVQLHAGDRASFLSMVGHSGSDDASHVDRLHRRACFRAYSHFYGAQIATRYSVMMVRNEPAGSGLETFVSLRGRMGLRRLRLDATVTVDRYFVTTVAQADGVAKSSPAAIDRAGFERAGAPVLSTFCTKPMPRLQMIEERPGVTRVDLAEPAVGLSGAVDLVFGTVTRGVPDGRPDGKPHGLHTMAKIDLPTSLLVTDILVHRGDYGRLTPELYVYADPGAEESQERRDRSPLIKTQEQVEFLGSGLSNHNQPDVPRHTEMLAHLCGGLGWDADEFDIYRLRIEYPLMHTVVRVALPAIGR